MVRIFRHYLSAKLLLIVALEALVFMLSVHLGLAFNLSSPALADAGDVPLFPTAVIALGLLIVMNGVGLYSADHWKDLQTVRARLIAAGLVAIGLVIVITHLPPSFVVEPRRLAITLLAIFTGVSLVRFAFYKLDKLVFFKPRVLVLGTGSRVAEFAQFAQRNRNHLIIGYVPFEASAQHYVPPSLVLPMAAGESLPSMVKKHEIDQIVIAVRDRRGKLPMHELVECRLQGVKITELATAYEREYRKVSLESISASWIMLDEGFSQGSFRSGVKRLFDLSASALLLLLSFPIILVAAGCVFLEGGFPVLYRQERVGQRGRVFSMYKLRSMTKDAECDGTPRWAATQDVRTTRVGRIIRKLHIDELPQIINVLKGEMSFVGPRPERPYFVDQLVKQIPYYSLRHSIKPGITGWAQVRYPYGASLEETVEKLQYDLYYVKNHTLFLDLVILLATIEVVFSGKGAR